MSKVQIHKDGPRLVGWFKYEWRVVATGQQVHDEIQVLAVHGGTVYGKANAQQQMNDAIDKLRGRYPTAEVGRLYA